MEKATLNYIIDITILIAFVIVFITGLMKWPGLLRNLGFENINWVKITRIHNWSGLIMGIGALGHIILHWRFISCQTKNLFQKKDKEECEIRE